jgi:purine catabolism regulator
VLASPSCASALRAAARRGFVPRRARAGALALPVARGRPGAATGRRPRRGCRRQGRGPLTELDRLTLHQAVTIVALELLRRRVVDDTERRLAGDVLSALVAGELAGPSSRGGWSRSACASAPARSCSRPPRAARRPRRRSRGRCARSRRRPRRPQRALPVRARAGGHRRRRVLRARRAAARARLADGGRAAAGRGGRTVAPADLRRGFHEARCALEARALAVNGSGSSTTLATYRDLGSFQLLLSLQDDDALRLFCDSILGPIEESEGAYGGELMRSLEAFIECNGQWERAAKALFCHRHTLRYRIRRVEELTGRSLDSARDRIDFWLALRGRELVHIERT